MDDLRPFLRRRPDGRCRLMGILNVTPDSFHVASRVDLDGAVERGLEMWSAGADWVDVGGESTRPGATPVDSVEEAARVIPVIQALRQANPDGLISIDTRRSDVAGAALDAGANMVNDVSGLRDSAMEDLLVERGCAVCIMHMKGEPGNMQQNPTYDDVVSEIIKLDADNKAGLKASYVGFQRAAEVAAGLQQLRTDNPDAKPEVMAGKIGDFIKAEKLTGESLQQALFMQSQGMFGAEKKDEAEKLLIEAQKAAPKTALAKQIDQILKRFFGKKNSL